MPLWCCKEPSHVLYSEVSISLSSYCLINQHAVTCLVGCFVGADCSVDMAAAHWSTLTYASSPPPSTLARASHSAVLWEGSVIVYGGYRFLEEGGGYYDDGEESMESGWGMVEPVDEDVLQYGLDSGVWEVVTTTAAVVTKESEPEGGSGQENKTSVSTPRLPAPRYGHSAVIYDVRTCICS